MIIDYLKHKSWEIIDSSKIQDFMTCPRMFFFRHVLGWELETANVHLVFGTAVHKAMEVLYQPGSKPHYDEDSVVEAFQAFYSSYRESFSEEYDQENKPKTPDNFALALPSYVGRYKPTDNFTVLCNEICGTVTVNSDPFRLLHVKMDTICERENGEIFSLEHKTGTNFSSKWARKWIQKTQVGSYAYAIACMYANRETYGVTINGLFIKNPPRTKKDGTRYANSTESEFHRVPIVKTIPQMNDWLSMVNFYLEFIEIEFDNLFNSKEEDEVMTAFPKNTESCDKYFGCPYADYCAAWQNPLQKTENVPYEFKVHFWDPREKEETAAKIIDL